MEQKIMTKLDKINEFRKEFQGKYYKPLSKDDYLRKKFGDANINFFIPLQSTKEKGLIGLATIYIIDSLTRTSLVIEDFIIDKKYRNQGYGIQLMKDIIEIAKKMKVDCIEICTKKENKIAQKLLSKFNFKDRRNIAYRLWLK